MMCGRCGDPGREIELVRDGTVVGAGALCDVCFAAAAAGADELRRQFEELLAAGIPRDMANDIMIARVTGEAAQA